VEIDAVARVEQHLPILFAVHHPARALHVRRRATALARRRRATLWRDDRPCRERGADNFCPIGSSPSILKPPADRAIVKCFGSALATASSRPPYPPRAPVLP